jgi:hypothetical protein
MGRAKEDQAEIGGHALSAASSMSDVSEPEREIVEAHSRPNAALIHETIRAEGEGELGRSVPALLLSGLAAGLAMGIGARIDRRLCPGRVTEPAAACRTGRLPDRWTHALQSQCQPPPQDPQDALPGDELARL